MDNLVRVGDRVEVINKKKQFNLYSLQAMKMGAKHWHSGAKIDNGTIGYIVTIAEHFDAPNSYPSIALVRLEAGEVEVLIGIDGLKKIEPEFEVGDTVKFIKHEDGKNKWEEHWGLKVGDEGIVEIIKNHLIGVNYFNNGNRIYSVPSQLKKISNTPKTYDVPTEQAIKDSIIHHEDNLYRLKTLKGNFTNSNYNCFVIDTNQIFYDSAHCALCNRMIISLCNTCPFTKKGYKCDRAFSHWRKIKNARTRQ